jgi:arylsulfatase A-like enzyme
MRQYLIFALTVFLLLSFSSSSFSEISSNPNIILITADDLGFDDLSIHNNPIVKTPSLDALAKKSVRFDDFSVSPVCATTRASLLTGRHYYRTGVSGVHGGRDYLNKEEVLISNILQENGYVTGTWGKWHLGKTDGYLPWDRGFDDAYYAELYRHENSFGFLNNKPVDHNKWVSEVITDYAIAFIDNSKKTNKAFFAYLSYLAPHEPWLAPSDFVVPYLELGLRPAVANLYGMISEMDFHIGRLMAHLDKHNLLDNTIVVFMSDNGPWWDSSNFGAMTKAEWKQRNPSNYNGNKGQSWQNGVKSPLFVFYGKQLTPSIVERFVNVQDIMPTLLEMANISTLADQKPLDGQSFYPYLLGDTSVAEKRSIYLGSHDVISTKALFNQWTPLDAQARAGLKLKFQPTALRNERYKLVLNHSSNDSSYPTAVDNYLLFDMQKDPFETTNIIEQQAKIAMEMKVELAIQFEAFKQDSDSFKTPVYEINSGNDVSVINAFGPASTKGNTQSRAHTLSQMKAKGDIAFYDVDVKTSGCFKVYIKQRGTQAAGLLVSLTINARAIEFLFSGESTQYVGDYTLSEGPTRMSFEVIDNQSMKPWSQVDGLRRILFVPCSSKFLVETMQLPN